MRKTLEVFLIFGKHKGKAVDQVFRDEPSYYDWIMKSEFPLFDQESGNRDQTERIQQGFCKTRFVLIDI